MPQCRPRYINNTSGLSRIISKPKKNQQKKISELEAEAEHLQSELGCVSASCHNSVAYLLVVE